MARAASGTRGSRKSLPRTAQPGARFTSSDTWQQEVYWCPQWPHHYWVSARLTGCLVSAKGCCHVCLHVKVASAVSGACARLAAGGRAWLASEEMVSTPELAWRESVARVSTAGTRSIRCFW